MGNVKSMDRQIITKRINLMIKLINRLKQFKTITFEEYVNNFDFQLITERLLEVLVELASDINGYLLVQLYQSPPDTYSTSFREVGQKKIISHELAIELAKSAGMRNILVHQYVDIDSQIVYASIKKALIQYPQYIQEITIFLNSLEVANG